MCKYELSVEILFVKKANSYYMNIMNFYFYPKSFTWGSFQVAFIRVDEKDAKEVIEQLKPLAVEDETHIRYKSKARLRSEKINQALADHLRKKREKDSLLLQN